jgi:hypothetical protein
MHEGGSSGFRKAGDPHGIARALTAGAEGWLRYWEHYRSANLPTLILLRGILLGLTLSRICSLAARSIAQGKPMRENVRLTAYVEHWHSLLRL